MDTDFEIQSEVLLGSHEDSYREFIIICQNVDYKENVPEEQHVKEGEIKIDSVKQPNTKQCQFVKMIEFASVYNDDNTGKTTLNELWEKLAIELNELGPPIRTVMQWRRVWSIYKYNKKRTEFNNREISSQVTGTPSQTRKRTSAPRSNPLQEISSDPKMSIQLGLLAEQNGRMIQNQEAIMAKIDKSNEILAIIAGITSETSLNVPNS